MAGVNHAHVLQCTTISVLQSMTKSPAKYFSEALESTLQLKKKEEQEASLEWIGEKAQ